MSVLIDDIARVIASPISRRRAFRLVGGAVGGAVLASLGLPRAARAQPQNSGCTGGQVPCDQTCCYTYELCCGGTCYGIEVKQAYTCCGTVLCRNLSEQCCTNYCCKRSQTCCGLQCCAHGQGCCGNTCCPENSFCCGGACCSRGNYCCAGKCVPSRPSNSEPCFTA